jgi:predicted alpha/beta-hydrolase family hydrolase
VRGVLHRATDSSGDFLVVTHGASGNANAALLVTLAQELACSGISVLRCDLPYRQRRPHGPPSPANAKDDQEGLRRAVNLMKDRFAGRAFLGGSSYGGRQASLLTASHPGLVEGLVLLSYPLHPPGKPTQLRTAHFSQLQTPSLFVSGSKDVFGTIDELEAAIKLIPARTELVRIAGASHGLSKKGSADEVAGVVKQNFLNFFSRND